MERQDHTARRSSGLNPDELIPNRYFFVWSGTKFPYYARLAIESLLVTEPEAEVELHWFSDEPSGEHLEAVLSYARVTMSPVELSSAFAELLGPEPETREAVEKLWADIPVSAVAARSNLMRYALLARHGGVYLDCDVIVVRPLRDLLRNESFIGQEQVWSSDEARVRGEYRWWMAFSTAAWAVSWFFRRIDSKWFAGRMRLDRALRPSDRSWRGLMVNNAILGSVADGDFVRGLLEEAPHRSPTIRFALGPSLVDDVAREPDRGVTILDADAFFSVPPSFSFRFFEDSTLRLPSAARLIHYVGSNHKELLSALEPADVMRLRDRAVFYRLAADVAERATRLERKSGSRPAERRPSGSTRITTPS